MKFTRKERKSMRKTRKQRGGSPPLNDKTSFIYDVILLWRKEGGFVRKANDYNYYLSCGKSDDYNHHIHIILTDSPDVQRYLYKRNGKHDTAKDYGFAFFPDDRTYCVEKGHPAFWNVRRWTNFLYDRLCIDEYFGTCK
jgi:hypothetical protein